MESNNFISPDSFNFIDKMTDRLNVWPEMKERSKWDRVVWKEKEDCFDVFASGKGEWDFKPLKETKSSSYTDYAKSLILDGALICKKTISEWRDGKPDNALIAKKITEYSGNFKEEVDNLIFKIKNIQHSAEQIQQLQLLKDKLNLLEKTANVFHDGLTNTFPNLDITEQSVLEDALKVLKESVIQRADELSQEISNKSGAATTLQKYVRGKTERETVLPANLFPLYAVQSEILKRNNQKEMNQSMRPAEGGRIAVFLPKQMEEVVIKKTGKFAAIERFHQMQEARSILRSQGSSHLIIPQAGLCGQHLIEERLPINVDIYHNMGLYLSNLNKFDEAVREFTRFFSKTSLGDIVDIMQQHPITGITGKYIRYDNLPLYIENNEAKIGLIDLEQLQPGSRGNLYNLAYIFPYHLDIIIDEAKKCEIIHRYSLTELEESAEEGKIYLKQGYSDHHDWIEKNNQTIPLFELSKNFDNVVSLENEGGWEGYDRALDPEEYPENFISSEPELNPELRPVDESTIKRLNYLTGIVEQVFKELKDDFRYKSTAPLKNPENLLKELKNEVTPEQFYKYVCLGTFSILFELCNSSYEQDISMLKKAIPDLTESERVMIRSPIINLYELYSRVGTLIHKHLKVYEGDGKYDISNEYAYECAARNITLAMITELVKGGEICACMRVNTNEKWIRF